MTRQILSSASARRDVRPAVWSQPSRSPPVSCRPRVGEVFINGGKSGNDIASVARDAGALLSLALQHGVPPKTIRHAVTRGASKSPRRFWARSLIPSQRNHFREASDGC